MKISRFTYSGEGVVTAIYADQANYRVWLGIQNGTSCKLLVQDVFNPNETIFEVAVIADRINDIAGNNNNIFLALDDDTNFGMWLSIISPASSNGYITYPGAITEAPVRVAIGTYVVFLTPGEDGSNAYLARYTSGSVFQNTLELYESGENITYARGLAIDSNDQIWVACSTTPMQLLKINSLATLFEIYDVA